MAGYEVIGAEEFAEVKDVFDNGGVLFRHGFDNLRNNSFKVLDFEKAFATEMNVKNALAVSSGSAALRVALAAIGVGPGDEVITQAFTFVATVEAIVESGADPVCAEVDQTLNLDPVDLRRRISAKTKAVIVVHMLGNPARMEEIQEICRSAGVFLIEDTAWGCGGTYQNNKLGTIGDIGTFSFDFAKAITTGEGGMLVTNNDSIFEKAKAWHDHGHENNPNVPRWEDTRSSSGFNFRMSELQGAVGLAQLKKLKDILKTQRHNKECLWNEIKDIEEVVPRVVPSGGEDTADALCFFLPTASNALKCRRELLKFGHATKILPEAISWHFAGMWEHITQLNLGVKGGLQNAFPQSKSLLEKSVSIPVSYNLDEKLISNLRNSVKSSLL
jgi:8-amino-3,8-dideoxy-alpha-D-manno-octulosonate transaminase